VIEGLTKVFYPEASNTVIFVIMVLVLLVKPAASSGRSADGDSCGQRRRSHRRTFARDVPAGHGGHGGAARHRAASPASIRVRDEGAVLRAVRMRVQLAHRLRGLLSFGHAMFLGTAGYVCAHAAKEWGWPPELAILAGTLAAAALGIVAGTLAIRRQGIYFAMITLALGADDVLLLPAGAFHARERTASRRCRAASCSDSSTCRTRW
jgi:branched-chain amino acid transport system permease protein